MRLSAGLFVFGLMLSGAARSQDISEADLRRHIEILASDEFEGREPGTAGENKTVNYIATQWSKAGFRPAGTDGSWYAPVTLTVRTPQSYRLALTDSNSHQRVRVEQDDIVLRSRESSYHQSAIPVVFVGYAEHGQYEPAVTGKLVLLPRKPRDDSGRVPDFRNRKAKLLQDGAVGVITVLDDQDRWTRFQRFFQRASTALADPENHAELEGVISFDQFQKLMRKSGQDPERLLADRDELAVIELGLNAAAKAETQVRSYISHNVIGKIPGTDPKSGALLFLGHWDHFGICRSEDPLDPDKDRICNGAVDNASGISLLIETAKRLSADQHDRDIFFLATTAEEKGLLGAEAFANHPPVPLQTFKAVFNADTVALSGSGQEIAVVGMGRSSLDSDIALVAEEEGRDIDQSGKGNAYVKRQDGYVFLERGVPAYMITSAFADEESLQAFLDGAYHDVTDEANDSLVLTGAAADANFHVALGNYFSSTTTYPGIATSGSADN
ncbi:M28 family peptidase [Parasphingorhabdus sp.]|uniref:M28 family peptidase n=1 Tax=Parasphingorhabdus sp. TaxID=2709688 RepID=UPI003A92E8A5